MTDTIISPAPASDAAPSRNRRLDEMPDLLTLEEVADYLQVAPETIRFWRKIGTAPRAIKVGKHLRFPRSAVEAFLAEHGA